MGAGKPTPTWPPRPAASVGRFRWGRFRWSRFRWSRFRRGRFRRGRFRRGRPAVLVLRTAVAAGVSAGALAVAGPQPASFALVAGALTWLARTGRRELAPPVTRPAAPRSDRSLDAIHQLQ